MADIEINNITTGYGDNLVLKDLSLSIKQGESISIVGPSSCGKTTLLRAIAGFNKLVKGEIYIGETLVSSGESKVFIEPEDRNIGVVFQDYAVWPHMTVIENVLYPLEKRGVNKEEAETKAMDVLRKVKMSEYYDRLPSQLSGGQQQRVALARALVSSEDIVLLDEPITNLDATLREEMSYEIQRLQREFGITVIYITHDQETAMTISDTMVIMSNDGKIEQIGTPEEIWRSPINQYVYRFLGVSNFIHVRYEGGSLYVEGIEDRMRMNTNKDLVEGKKYMMASRPIQIDLEEVDKDEKEGFIAKMERVTYLGPQFDYFLSMPGNEEIRVHQDSYDAFSNGVPEEGKFYRLIFNHPRFYEIK